MVAAALGRLPNKGGSATGGLSLASMPAPEHLGPLGAHLVSDTFTSCQGRPLFVGGSEVAVIDEPRLIEVVRTRPSPPASATTRATSSSPPTRSASTTASQVVRPRRRVHDVAGLHTATATGDRIRRPLRDRSRVDGRRLLQSAARGVRRRRDPRSDVVRRGVPWAWAHVIRAPVSTSPARSRSKAAASGLVWCPLRRLALSPRPPLGSRL
jgi:hypothetical protein